MLYCCCRSQSLRNNEHSDYFRGNTDDYGEDAQELLPAVPEGSLDATDDGSSPALAPNSSNRAPGIIVSPFPFPMKILIFKQNHFAELDAILL